MPIQTQKLKKDVIKTLMDYLTGIAEGKNKAVDDLTTGDLKKVVKEISAKISNYIYEREDAEIYEMIRPKVAEKGGGELSMGEFTALSVPPELLSYKTLQKCFSGKENNTFTSHTIGVVEAFCQILEKEATFNENLKRVAGIYNVYNLHNTHKGKFQIANLHIELNDNSYFEYINRVHKRTKSIVNPTIIGNDKLLITLDDNNNNNTVLTFFAYIGSTSHPGLIQAVYMYNNGIGHTIASIAVFQKTIKNKVEKLKPRREVDRIEDQVIQRFLLNKATMLQTPIRGRQRLQFSRSDIELSPGPFHTEANYYDQVGNLLGDYYLYFTEAYPSMKDYLPNNYYSTVGKGLFRIYRDEYSGVIKCKMKTRKNRQGDILKHQGILLNNTLRSGDHHLFTLYEGTHKERYLHLLIARPGSNIIYGCHNIMYSVPGKMGAGVVILRKIEEGIDFENTDPEALLPCPHNESRTENYIVNYLSCTSNALVQPISHFEKLKTWRNHRYEGTYKIYSYGGGGIRVGSLKIYKSGFVEHRSITGGEELVAYGKVEVLRSILAITLKNKDNNRIGFCIFQVEADVPPAEGKIYVGTFCGATRRNGEFPIGSRMIMEFIQKDTLKKDLQPEVIPLKNRAHSEVDKEIWKALGNKRESLIGFLKDKSQIFSLKDLKKFNKKSPKPGKVYLQAALFEDLHSGKPKKTRRLLKEAKGFGYDKVEEKWHEKRRELATHYYERAVYHWLVKEDAQQAIRLMEKAINLGMGAETFDVFEKELHEFKGKENGSLLKGEAYRKLKHKYWNQEET